MNFRFRTLVVVLLLTAGLRAQEPVPLTDIAGSQRAPFPLEDLVTYQGRVYTANRFDLSEGGSAFSLLDTASGTLEAISTGVEFLGGRIPGREAGAFQIIDDKLFATGYTTHDGYEIFRIDGKQAAKLTNLPGTPVSELVSFQGAYYFLSTGAWIGKLQHENSTLHRLQLWRTDGTPQGTYRVADINPGGSFSAPDNFYATPTALYFSATGPSGRETYRMSLLGGEQVSQVVDVNPGTEGSNPYDFLEVNDTLYFLAQPEGGEGFQLFAVAADATVTAVGEKAPPSKTRLFPNPTASVLHVIVEEDDPLTAVSIYDYHGRCVSAEAVDLPHHRVSVTGLAAGPYLVRLAYASGRWEYRTVAVLR